MKIGEVARRLGTTPRTLRFYEERGLVTPARSERGTRRYTERELERFRTILTLAAAGMALADIEVLARVRPGSRTGDQASQTVRAMLARLGEELKARREGLERLEADLGQAREVMAACLGCAKAPRPATCGRCPAAAGRHGARVLGVIWETDVA